MSKIAVVYWSGTGNTEAMANAVLKGAKGSGAERYTAHAQEVSHRVSELASKDNILYFLRQGNIDPKRTGLKLREVRLSAERYERQKRSQGHPDDADLADTKAVVRSFLTDL